MHLPLNSDERPSALAEFPVVISLPIQWGDQDAFGHVNNTVPIRWFESSRIAYIEQTETRLLMRGDGLGPILASVTCDYRLQLHYPDTVLIGCRLGKIGRASMTMEHAVFSREQRAVAAEGLSIVVIFNYAENRPVRVPDEVRAALAQLEGRPL